MFPNTWPFLAMTNTDYVYIYKAYLQAYLARELLLKIERKEDNRGSGHALKVWYKAREEL